MCIPRNTRCSSSTTTRKFGPRCGVFSMRSAIAHALFDTAESFLNEVDPETPGCVLLDLHLPGLSGLELQSRLTTPGYSRPVVFFTASATVDESVRAMKAGAIDFLMKPLQPPHLLSAIENALSVEDARRRELAISRESQDRTARLTPREREVLEHLVRGLLNKQIAAVLGTTEKTVKVHRARVFQKVGARSVVQLVRYASPRTGVDGAMGRQA